MKNPVLIHKRMTVELRTMSALVVQQAIELMRHEGAPDTASVEVRSMNPGISDAVVLVSADWSVDAKLGVPADGRD